jgi:hypothetical protein
MPMPTRDQFAALARELGLARENLTTIVDRVAALQERLRTDAPTIVSLDRLAQRRHPVTPAPKTGERFEGEEAALATDAWEISLISEEG